jgi:hypothetical protein
VRVKRIIRRRAAQCRQPPGLVFTLWKADAVAPETRSAPETPRARILAITLLLPASPAGVCTSSRAAATAKTGVRA